MTVVFTTEPFLEELMIADNHNSNGEILDCDQLTEFVFRHRREREIVTIPSSVSHASNDIRKINQLARGIAVIGG